jgi:surfeit locus 1 family protein
MARWKKILPAVIFLALSVFGLLQLGLWQQSRMQQKEVEGKWIAGLRALPPVTPTCLNADNVHRWIPLTGAYDHSREVLLENQRHGNEAGYRILTPFVFDGGTREVLVDRGWVRRSFAGGDFLAPFRDEGDQTIRGLILEYPTFSNTWGNATTGVGPAGTTVLLRLDPSVVPAVDGVSRAPVYVQVATSRNPAVRAFVAPLPSGAQHREYMLTWFTLAGLVVLMGLFWLRTQLKKR